MSLREEVAEAVPMIPIHHEDDDEEVMLKMNAKSHEAERRRQADLQDEGPRKKKEVPETVLTRPGDAMKTVFTRPSDTTMVETPGITPLSSGSKVDQTFSAAVAPITPPCTGEAENDGKPMTALQSAVSGLMNRKEDEDEERNNQGDNNVHTMSRDDYLEVVKNMASMAGRLMVATAESRKLALMQEALTEKDALMVAQADGWEEQRKMDHFSQMQRDNDSMKMMLESKAGSGESKTRYKPTKPAVFKDNSSIMAWQQLKTIETYAIRANLAPSSFLGVLYDHLGPDEQTWLQGIVQTYAWTMESCTIAQWNKVKNMFTEKFAGSRIARETAVTGALQVRNERMGINQR